MKDLERVEFGWQQFRHAMEMDGVRLPDCAYCALAFAAGAAWALHALGEAVKKAEAYGENQPVN